jgi:predicted Zn-dependent peptidase
MNCPHPRVSRKAGARLTALVALLATLALGAASEAADIVSHPDQLKFPPLQYEPPKAADYRVRLGNGMMAYLVPDRSLPLVNVVVLMRFGSDLDPAGKEGLAGMTLQLLTRSGTQRMNATQLEDRLSFLGALLDASMGGGGGGPFGPAAMAISPVDARVTLNLLSKDVDEGLQLLVDCLKTPAFQEDRLKLQKEQTLQRIKSRNDDSGNIEDYEWGYQVHGEDHWSNRYATKASIESITRDDLLALHRRYFGPRNFVLAVSGDFDRAAMVKKLEKAFADWPTPGERPGAPAAPAAPMASGWVMVEKDVNQARVSIGLPGLQREDPDIYAARVMNDILGGGGFTSRLVNRIRSDEGLAYQVRSALTEGYHYPEPWRLVFQTKVRSVAYACQIALAEVARMRDTLVTAEELEASKDKFIDAFPGTFGTAATMAGALAAEELTGRHQRQPRYYADYRDRIRAVTAQDVQRVARRLLDPSKLLVLMVGKTGEMLQGDPKYDARLTALAGGEPKRLPLRDPMTMAPMPSP